MILGWHGLAFMISFTLVEIRMWIHHPSAATLEYFLGHPGTAEGHGIEERRRV